MLTLSTNGKRVNREIEMVRNAMELEFVGALTLEETRTLYRLLDKLQARAAQMFKNPDAWREILAKHRHEISPTSG